MLKPDKRCKTCDRIKAEKAKGSEKFLNRLYNSKAYHKGGESLLAIARDVTNEKPYNGVVKTTYQSLIKHTKYHQALTEDDLINSKVVRAAKRKDNEIVKQLVQHRDVRQEIMSKGLEQLETGELKLTAASVVTAANKEADLEMKEKDQQLKVMEMIAMFQSGEIKRLPTDE